MALCRCTLLPGGFFRMVLLKPFPGFSLFGSGIDLFLEFCGTDITSNFTRLDDLHFEQPHPHSDSLCLQHCWLHRCYSRFFRAMEWKWYYLIENYCTF